MENHLFNLKFTAKQLNRMSKKAEKDEKAEKAKVKKAIEKGNMEGARIYAQNAIRQKNQAMNYLRMASRVDAVASRVESAVKMNLVTKQMAGVVKGMDASLQSMDVEKIAKVMDGFEKSFEDVDVRSEYIEQSINSSTAAGMPEEQVESLLQQVADEHGLEFQTKMNAAVPFTELATQQQQQAAAQPQMAQVGSLGEAEEDQLAERLRKLREQSS